MTPACRGERIAALYQKHGGKLRGLMQGRFGVPEAETENLLHDVFATLLNSPASITDDEKWLVGAVCNRARLYWRDARPKESAELLEGFESDSTTEEVLMLEQFLGQLPEKGRDVLRLKYLEGMSGKEIARRYGTSVGYTNVLIHRSLEQARAIARGPDA